MAPPVLQTTGIRAMSSEGRLEPYSPAEGERPFLRLADIKKPSVVPGFIFRLVPATDVKS